MESGIKESKELVEFLAKAAGAVKKSLEDGKFQLSDGFHFISVLMCASDAFKDISEVPAELKDLSEAELMELFGVVSVEVPELSPKVISIVKASVKLLSAGQELYKAIKE